MTPDADDAAEPQTVKAAEYARIALAVLTKATLTRDPGCLDDTRYTADHDTLTTSDRNDMAHTCRACPLLDLCHAYATADNPPTGYWAGHPWTRRGPRTTTPGGLTVAAPVDKTEAPPSTPAGPMRPCIECGTDYASPSGRAGVCSPTCRRKREAARHARYRADKATTEPTP